MDEHTLYDMAKRLGLPYMTIYRRCTIGRRGVSGHIVKLERWLNERGWVTSDSAVERFRQRLNDPEFVPLPVAQGIQESSKLDILDQSQSSAQ